jgi:hypothetical protein
MLHFPSHTAITGTFSLQFYAYLLAFSGPKIFVVNAETGAVVYSQNATYTMQFESRLYDKYLAVYVSLLFVTCFSDKY